MSLFSIVLLLVPLSMGFHWLKPSIPKCGDDVIRPLMPIGGLPPCVRELRKANLPTPIVSTQQMEANFSFAQMVESCSFWGRRLGSQTFVSEKCTEFRMACKDHQFSAMLWQLWITDHVGVVHLLTLSLSMQNKTKVIDGGLDELRVVNLQANLTQATVAIPPLYSLERRCSNSGSRRYVVAGPHDQECDVFLIKRGITDQEAKIVMSTLMQAIQPQPNLP